MRRGKKTTENVAMIVPGIPAILFPTKEAVLSAIGPGVI